MINESEYETVALLKETLDEKDVNESKETLVRSKDFRINIRFLKNLFKVLQTGELFALRNNCYVALLIISAIIFALMEVAGIEVETRIIQALIEHNIDKAWSFIFLNIVITSIRTIIHLFKQYLSQAIAYYFRFHITSKLLLNFFDDANFYKILSEKENEIDNPSQRIVNDVHVFSEDFGYFMETFIFTSIRGFTLLVAMIISKQHWLFFVIVVPIPLMNFLFYGLFVPLVSRYVYIVDRFEGDFRYAEARIREYCESLTFFKAANKEKDNCEHFFKKLLKKQKIKAILYFFLQAYNVWQGFIPNIFLVLAIGYLVWMTSYGKGSSGVVTKRVLESYRLSDNFKGQVSLLFTLATPVSRIIGNCNRISMLFSSCIEVKQKRQEESNFFIDNHDEVEFSDVTCLTPNGKLLTENLSLSVKPGHSLLISGMSGVGKSSLLRMLSGVWAPVTGTISRPRTFGRRGIVFLPQNPYILRGSLKQNIVYPNKDIDISDEEALTLLEEAQIGYLGKAYDINDVNIDWAQIMSGGEAQRLQFARLFYYCPIFAVMDESTSAVSTECEDVLYNKTLSKNITCISVAHRKNVGLYHENELILTGNGGWELKEIDKDAISLPKKEWIKKISMTQNDVLEHPDPVVNDDLRFQNHFASAGINFRYIIRLFQVVKTMVTPFRWKTLFLILLHAFFAIASAFIVFPNALLQGYLLQSVLKKDTTMFFVNFGLFILIAVSIVFVSGLSDMISKFLGIHLRERLVNAMHEIYFNNRNYFKIIMMDGNLDNPDQMLTDDANNLVTGFDPWGIPKILEMFYLIAGFAIVGLISIILNWALVLMILVVFSGIFLIQYAGMTFVSKYTYKMDQMTGFFRFSLLQVKRNFEQIALYGPRASKRERVKIYGHFKRLLKVQWKFLLISSFTKGFANAQDSIAPFFGGLMLTTVLSFKLVPMNPDPDSYIRDITTLNNLINSAFGALVGFLSVMFLISLNAGSIARIGEFFEVIRKVDTQYNIDECDVPESDSIEISNATIATPKDQILLNKLSMQIKKGDRVLINGPSGSGKTSIMRTLSRLWPLHSGKLSVPSQVLFLPQRSYLAIGSLKDQIIYPDPVCKSDDENLMRILEKVNLSYLLERFGGFDIVKDWASVLSPGEQQRLGFARILYQQPEFAMLDESTSALDIPNERLMYMLCVSAGIGMISVGHRETLYEFHNVLLKLDGQKGYEVFCEKK